MKKTYEMKITPEYSHMENNNQNQELCNKYLQDKYIPQEFDLNLNVIK